MELNKGSDIGFALIVRLAGVIFNPARPEGIKFAIGGQHKLHLSLTPNERERDGFWEGLTCRVYAAVPASEDERAFVSDLIGGRFKEYSGMPLSLPHVVRGITEIESGGKIRSGYGVPFEYYPPSLRSLCDDVHNELFSAAVRFVKLMVWQQEVDSPHWPFESDHLYWRISNDGEYRAIGLRLQTAEGRSPVGFQWDEEDRKDFQALWDSGATEPLAHELLREARSLATRSPRSALLALTTALETGTKNHIGKMEPKSEWLMREMPSPPIFKLLRDYTPRLHNEKDVAYWDKLKPLFKIVQQIAEDRNDLAHTGTMTVSPKRLAEYINAASDILYILDYLEGHAWATRNVQAKIRKLVGWEGPRHQRTFYKMMSGE